MVNAEAASGNRPYPEAIIATSLQTSYCVMATTVPELNSGRPGPSDTRPSVGKTFRKVKTHPDCSCANAVAVTPLLSYAEYPPRPLSLCAGRKQQTDGAHQ